MDKKIFYNTSYQVIGRIAVTLFAVISTSLLTRYLGTIGFSEYSLIFSFIEIVAIIPNFGLVTLLIRELSQRDDKVLFSQMLSFRLILSIISFVTAILLLPLFPYTPTVKAGIIIASFYGFFLMMSGIYWAATQSKLQFGKVVIVQIVTAAISVLGVIIGVVFKLPMLYFIVSSVISVGAGFFLSRAISEYKSVLFTFTRQSFSTAFRKALPFALWTIFGIAYFKIDAILLSLYFPPSESGAVGIYALAYRIFEVLIILTGYFPQTLFPLFSKQAAKFGYIPGVRKNFFLTVFIGICASIGLYVFAPLFISILGGQDFQAAVVPAQILAPAVGLSMIASYFMNIALVHKREKLLVIVGVVALAINVGLNVEYIPESSYIATALITVITQCLVLLGSAGAAFIAIRKND